ncbi:hypothetical protein ACOMHN_033392 [Nucella lapillus]
MALHARLFSHNILRASKLKNWSHTTQAIERNSDKSTNACCVQTTNASGEEDKGREVDNSWPQCLTAPHWTFQPLSLEPNAPSGHQPSDGASHLTPLPVNSTTSRMLKTQDRSWMATIFPHDCIPSVVKSVSYTTDDIVVFGRNGEDCLGQGTVYENHPVTMLTEWGKGLSLSSADSTKDFGSSGGARDVSLLDSRHHFRRHSICDSNPTHRQPDLTDCSVLRCGVVPDAEGIFHSPSSDAHGVLHCSGSDVPQSSSNGDKSQGKGPSFDQLKAVETFFIESLPKFFKSRLEYRVYHPDVVFENNFWGENQVTVGINQYAVQMMKLRGLTHLKYAHVHMEVVSSACLQEEGVIRLQWRMVGLSQLKALRFWKYTAWSYSKSFKDDAEWIEGISILNINRDGLVVKHRLDRVTPSDEGITKAPSFAAKLALLFGLSAPKPSLSDFNSLLYRR